MDTGDSLLGCQSKFEKATGESYELELVPSTPLETRVLLVYIWWWCVDAELHVPVDLKDQASLLFFQTFIEKPRGYAGNLFRKAASHTCRQRPPVNLRQEEVSKDEAWHNSHQKTGSLTNEGHGPHLPPELRMFSSQT
jgi:hypothetical protein